MATYGDTDRLVALIEDDHDNRDVLARLLASVGLRVACYRNAEDFLDAEGSGPAACLIADVRLPGMSGLDLLELLRRRGDATPIILVTGYGDVPSAVRAIRAGAVDFLEKPVNPQGLLDLVHRTLDQSERLRLAQAERADFETRQARLTPREREVMKLMVSGMSNTEIASVLGISGKTLDIHRAKVHSKMETSGATELAALALRFGGEDKFPPAEAARGDSQARAKGTKRRSGRPRKER